MEYFKYDYKNVDSKLGFENYETFITNMKNYKYYLFDLNLIQYDPKINVDTKNKSKFIIFRQKIIFLLPYSIIFPVFLYYQKKQFFATKMLHRELKLVSYLFGMLLSIRIYQKALLKYEGDKILIPTFKNKLYTI